jgi:hypothetical protein
MTEYEIRDLGASMTTNIIEKTGQQGDYIAVKTVIVAGQIRAVSIEGVRYRLTRTSPTGTTLPNTSIIL